MNCNFAAFIIIQCHTVGLPLEHILEMLFIESISYLLAVKLTMQMYTLIPLKNVDSWHKYYSNGQI